MGACRKFHRSDRRTIQMLNRRELLTAALAMSTGISEGRAGMLPKERIRAILQERIDVAHQCVGMVAGQIDGNEHPLVT